MITLLMALFMVMFAMSEVSKTKFEVLKVTLHQTFSSAVFDGGSSILDRGPLKSSQTLPNSDLPGKDSPQFGEQPAQPGQTPGPKTASAPNPQPATPTAAARAASAAAANRQQDAQLARTVQQIREAIRRSHLGAYAHVVQDRANGVVIIRLVSDR